MPSVGKVTGGDELARLRQRTSNLHSISSFSNSACHCGICSARRRESMPLGYRFIGIGVVFRVLGIEWL